MPDAFTIRMFVPDGDPEGVRLIDRMNWTGQGIVFPRSKWSEVKSRDEFARTGVYILTGYSEGDDDLLTVYVGQADGIKNRIDSHALKKDFWDTGIVFVSNSGGGLNRAHVTWLEYAPVSHIEPYGESGKYKLVFSEKAKTVGPIKFGNSPKGTMQGPRYASIDRLLKSKTLSELFA